MSEPHLPSHSIEAEQSVLGALLLDNQAWERIAGVVAADDFTDENHRLIFRRIGKLITDGQDADLLTVSEAIKATDGNSTDVIAYLGKLAQDTPSAYNVRTYARIVRDHAERRKVVAIARDMLAKASAADFDPDAVRSETETRLESVKGAGHSLRTFGTGLDLEELAERDPEPPKFIIDGVSPAGYATLFAGHGGVGKSTIALYLAVCLAAGLPFFGIKVSRRRVLYLSCEDREGVLHWRLSRICRHLGIDMASLRGHLEILDLVGCDSLLYRRDPRSGNALTAAYGALDECMRQYQSEVLICDGTSDVYGGNENDRAEVKAFVNSMVALIPADTGAVILLAHVSKPSSTAGAAGDGYSGSTQWHNAVRARWYLYPETAQGDDSERAEPTGDLILDLQKNNFGRTDQSMRFAWNDDAHLFIGQQVAEQSHFDRTQQDKAEREGILAALKACAASDPPIIVPATMRGPRTAFHVLSQRPEFADSMRSGKPAVRRFWRNIEQLRHNHAIEETEYRRANRHFIAQFVLTPEGMRQCAA
jgi:RecA-family ATPase